MFNASQVRSPEETVIDLNPVLYPDGDQAISREGDLDDANLDKNFVPTPYLPPYLNPSRYPTAFQNSSNSTFETLFQFTPTLSNLLLLAALVGCTLWVIFMNLLLIGALRKAHERDREHVTDMYLINLLFADVLVGIFVFPFMSIVILIGYFPLSPSWCNLWVYFDYYLIIASSYGFAALMSSYLMMIRWPEYYPKSRRLHSVLILFIWLFSNAPWTAPFINDRVSFIYPDGVCGFSIQKNRYFTFYIGVTGLYFPLAVALVSGIFAVKYLKQSARAPFFRLLLQNESCHVHPIMPSPAASSDAEFNDLYHLRRDNNYGQKSHPQFGYPRPGLSPPQIPSESTDRSDDSSRENKKQQRYSLMSVRTFHRNKALYDSVRKHFPLVATSLILFVLSRSLFYTYFGIGAVVPHLFPPDLSHSVYWVMHSYAVAAPVVHLLLDPELRRSVVKFVNEGTFSISHHSDEIIAARTKEGMENVLPQVSVIDAPRRQAHNHHHHHGHHRHHDHYHNPNHKLECNGVVRTHDVGHYLRNNGFYK